MHIILSSPKFEGEVELRYNDDGMLDKYEYRAKMDNDMLRFFLSHFPFREEHLSWLLQVSKTLRTREVPIDTSFEAFWSAYGKKINKKRCEPVYEKMNETERISCITGIKAYNYFLMRSSRKKLDPENYLKYKSWQNDWKSIKD